MKTINKYIHKSLVFFTATFSLLFLACSDVGLGEAVDQSAPEITITSHSDNETVPSEFTLSGTAYDNKEVTSISISFESQKLYYKIVPGSSWYKQTPATGSEWVQVSGSEGSCKKEGKTWNWSIYIKTSEGESSSSTYTLNAVVTDELGNSGKKSKVELSLIMDEAIPDVMIYKPELLTGSYDSVFEEAKNYSLQDGNVLSKLFNGTITLTGRQSESISFKELRIEFDNGKLAAGTRKITGDVVQDFSSVDDIAKNVLFDETSPTVYFSKTLKSEDDNGNTIADLRNWELTIEQDEWVSSSKNSELLSCGKTTGSGKIIRVVTTSLSNAGAWERKVIGYFVWWPEADIPWIKTYAGSTEDKGEDSYAVYPSSNFTGFAQDDDGIAKLSYSIQKQNGSTWTDYESNNLALSEEETTYSAFAIQCPAENGIYKITITVEDIYGKTYSETKYFKTLDVSPPKINLTSPENNTSVLVDKDGNITFEGIVSDDGTIDSFSLIYLNPLADSDAENLIRYMSGNEEDWNLASTNGTETSEYKFTENSKEIKYKNTVYKISLGSSKKNAETKLNEYNFKKIFNIFSDFGINAETKPLVSQRFILRAVDNGGTKTVNQIVLTGDTEVPLVTVDSIQQFNSSGTKKIDEFLFTDDSVPTFDVIKDGDYAILKGTWYDNSVAVWNNDKSKIDKLSFKWEDAEFTITSEEKDSNGIWNWVAKAEKLPSSSSSISVSLTDLAGNTKVVNKSVFAEQAEVGVASIGSDSEDGAYTTGKEIIITLVFRKNTVVTYSGTKPQLKLNNGGIAEYDGGGEEANPTSTHKFKYTVQSIDSDVERLDVVSLNTNGAKYIDASVSGGKELTDDDLTLPKNEKSKTLAGSREIKIDKTAPKIESFTVISDAGYYNAGKNILFMLTFDESVSISGFENLGLEFTSFSPSSISAQAGSSNIMFTYKVNGSENSLTPLKLKNITGTENVSVLDKAGNALSDWSWTKAFDKNIYIDTTAPASPTVNAAWGSTALVTAATSFTLTGIESGATAEYSIDGGTNWQTYKNTAVSLSNNGSYIIQARQTDRAGNVSTVSDGGTIVVEKGDFLSKITADTVSGTYSVNKGGTIVGRIVFRKDISLPSDATVTLNVKNSSGTQYVLALTKDSSATMSGGADYTFTYNIQEGDYIDSSAALSVTSWSFTSVTYSTGVSGVGDVTFDMSFGKVVTSGKSFTDNRKIYILTGNPTVQSATLGGTVNSDGTVSSPKLTITFDRAVSKVSGNITLSLEGDSYSDKFIAPAVISTSDWNSAFKDYYTVGLNGATGSVGSTLTNDNTTKYVLNWATESTDSTLISKFVNEGWNKVEVPIVASAVALSTDKKTVTVDLSSTYKLPIMGAKYKVTVPAGAFADEVQNKNKEYVSSATAVGVEPPVIRINKGNQTITPGTSPNFTTAATVTMPDTADMRIDCQTPGAEIYYNKTEKSTTTYQVIESGKKYDTKANAEKTIPNAPEPTTKYSNSVSLGSSVANYASATGLKVAISAVAKKGSVPSENSFEYATRTVLKLNIESGGYSQSTDGNASTASDIKENGSSLTFNKLKVWVWGGDYSYGGNSISPFPLSWSDTSCFKLMKTESGFGSGMASKWYWISWDITTATYHGFILGDVPEDAETLGPSEWYSGEGGWDSQKPNYILYPGETLEMYCSSSVTYSNGQFHWQKKNHGKR